MADSFTGLGGAWDPHRAGSLDGLFQLGKLQQS
jgi:hypothetical protein